MPEMKTLGDVLPEQITRVQGLIERYRETPNGWATATVMQMDVDAALKSMICEDLAGMITAYKALLEWED
jgi:hypothetical protein